MLVFLQINSDNGKLHKGAVARAMEQWNCKKDQVYSLWNAARKVDIGNRAEYENFVKNLSPKKNKCGRKMIPLNTELMKKIPANKRGSMHSLEAML